MNSAYELKLSITGDLLTIRGDDAKDLSKNVANLVEEVDGLFKALADLKEAGVANGVFTGNAAGAVATKAPDSAPPGEMATPTCKHGPMKDLRAKSYKSGDFFCKEYGSDCKPVKL